MTTISIIPDSASFQAIAGSRRSTGRTPGEALDALNAQLPAGDSGEHLVVQSFRPDSAFTAIQQQRLVELMARWRTARDAGHVLVPAEQLELESLIDAELDAVTQRSASLFGGSVP